MSSAPTATKKTSAPRKAASSTAASSSSASLASSASSSSPAVAAPVAAPVVAPVAAPTISHVESSSSTSASASASASSSSESVNVVTEFNSLVEQVNSLRSTLSNVFSSMKKLEKQIPRELKKAQKGRRRKASASTDGEDKPKKETVFTKPTAISDALCTFLGVPKATLLSRSEVTTRICRYAKEHSLMVKQVIKADAPMRKLLALTEKDELKILNLQRFLKPHYLKPAVATPTA